MDIISIGYIVTSVYVICMSLWILFMLMDMARYLIRIFVRIQISILKKGFIPFLVACVAIVAYRYYTSTTWGS